MKNEHLRISAGGAVDDPRQDHRIAPPAPIQDPEAAVRPPEAAAPVPIRDKLLWSWDDVAALTDMSRRLLEREVSAGRMPAPDVRIGRRACFRPATITAWLDAMADRQGRRSGR